MPSNGGCASEDRKMDRGTEMPGVVQALQWSPRPVEVSCGVPPSGREAGCGVGSLPYEWGKQAL